jgi:hypothetical protein
MPSLIVVHSLAEMRGSSRISATMPSYRAVRQGLRKTKSAEYLEAKNEIRERQRKFKNRMKSAVAYREYG